MKNIVLLFLLLIGQTVLAQDGNWRIVTDFDSMDGSLQLSLVNSSLAVSMIERSGSNITIEALQEEDPFSYSREATLVISCFEDENVPFVGVRFKPRVFYSTAIRPLVYRIGNGENINTAWLVHPEGMLFYTNALDDYFENSVFDDDNYANTVNASVFVAALVQDNSELVLYFDDHMFRGELIDVTASWNIEGLAEVIGECMAVFD